MQLSVPCANFVVMKFSLEVKLDEAEFWRLGLENFANVVSSLAGCVTAGIAWWAVWSWRSDQKWARSQELGKNILLNLRKYEVEIEHLVNPSSTLARTFGKVVYRRNLSQEELQLEQCDAMLDDYARQSETIDAVKADLNAILDEAEIFWGSEVNTWLAGVSKLQIELVNYRIQSSYAWHPDESSVKHRQGKRYIANHRAPSNANITAIGVSKSSEFTDFQVEWREEVSNLRSKVLRKMEQGRHS